MEEEWSIVSNGKNLKIIGILVIIIIGVGSVAAIALSVDEEDMKLPKGPDYTKTYSSITATEAKELIDANINLKIVDIRGCRCSWEKGHIPTAVWQTYSLRLYKEAQDLLIYDQNGNESEEFCESLVGNVYGAIYRLIDGIDSWINEGYEIYKVV